LTNSIDRVKHATIETNKFELAEFPSGESRTQAEDLAIVINYWSATVLTFEFLTSRAAEAVSAIAGGLPTTLCGIRAFHQCLAQIPSEKAMTCTLIPYPVTIYAISYVTS